MIYRDDQTDKFPVRMLSDGEKGIISLVADIAYRMALLNPDLLDRVLETPGVVLIDEIDLHLHPSWQKSSAGFDVYFSQYTICYDNTFSQYIG